MARTDFPSRTSMQEARFIAGDRRLFARFRRVLRDNVYRSDFGEFLATTLAEREQRYRKFGASPYIGEPNVKESAGGLRDMHTAMWLGAAKFGARTLRELADKGLITPREQAATDAALTFLWRVRNELHFFSGHKNDVLSRDLQPRIAKNLGYENDEDTLGVERFMRDYYLHARAIHRVSRRLIARCQETLSRRGPAERRQRQQALADGLVFFDGALHLGRRATARAARRARAPHEGLLALAPARAASCRSTSSARIEDRWTSSTARSGARPPCAMLFLDICRRGGGWRRRSGRCTSWAAGTVPAGVGRADLPGAVRRLPQVLGRPALAARRRAPGGAGARPVGGVGGRRPGVQRGGEARAPHARDAAARRRQGQGTRPRRQGHPAGPRARARIGLEPRGGALVEFLVAHHLTMSHIAQRRDIDDPKTIADFAAAAGDAQRLRMLYLLT